MCLCPTSGYFRKDKFYCIYLREVDLRNSNNFCRRSLNLLPARMACHEVVCYCRKLWRVRVKWKTGACEYSSWVYCWPGCKWIILSCTFGPPGHCVLLHPWWQWQSLFSVPCKYPYHFNFRLINTSLRFCYITVHPWSTGFLFLLKVYKVVSGSVRAKPISTFIEQLITVLPSIALSILFTTFPFQFITYSLF